MVDVKRWKNTIKFVDFEKLILITLVITIGILVLHNYGNNVVIVKTIFFPKKEQNLRTNSSNPKCNMFLGKWIFDNVSYPLYEMEQCSFLRSDKCIKHGSENVKFRYWRWQPHDCDIPRFNGSMLLEKIRGKKLMFVGDSLIRNQWQSMVCLIETQVPWSRKSWKLHLKDNLFTFKSSEYDVTIALYWSPYLLESSGDDFINHVGSIINRTVSLNSIEIHGRRWIDTDILVFDAFAWWSDPRTTLAWGSMEMPEVIDEETILKVRGYEIGLNTWSDWLETHVNRTKTHVYFMSQSPYHRGFGVEDDNNCINRTDPIMDEGYVPESVDPTMMRIAESVVRKLGERGVKVEYLNITGLTGYRIDAHPQIYRFNKEGHPLTDCMHFCLPGVPDIWNQILASYIIKS